MSGGRRTRGALVLGVLAAAGVLALAGGDRGRSAPVALDTCPVVAGDASAGGGMTGVSLVSPRGPLGSEELSALDRISAGWVAVLPYARIDGDGGILHARDDGDRGFGSGRLDLATNTIREAHASGLRVMVKPHLWDGRDWIGDFAPSSEAGWERFEDDYRRYILDFATLADSLDADLLVIGTELDRTVRERADFWTDLIGEIREVFDGALTYAANWDGFTDIPFWDELDYIGVDAFFPLSDSDTPTVAELSEAWQPVVAELSELCRETGRPLLFTEFGYRSIDGAAGPQWEMPREGLPETPVNLDAQVNAYRAFFEVWWDRPWVAGGFLWKWFPTDGRLSERALADYTPQHKPVEAVIREWYTEAER